MTLHTGTIPCQLRVATADSDSRRCLVRIGASTEVACMVPSNCRKELSVLSLSLYHADSADMNCLLNSMPYHDLLCMAPTTADTRHSSIVCSVDVNKIRTCTVLPISVGALLRTDLMCRVDTFVFSDVTANLIVGDSVCTSVICSLDVAAETDITVTRLNVGFTTTDDIAGTTRGELFGDLACQISTGRHDNDLVCLLNIADSEYVSDLNCELNRVAGEIMDYLALEVVLGTRHMSDVQVAVPPSVPIFADMTCSLGGAVDGEPAWSRFTADGSSVFRVYNMGRNVVSTATLVDGSTYIPATSISSAGNIWQISFEDRIIGYGQLVVLSINAGSKTAVLDQPSGKFSL